MNTLRISMRTPDRNLDKSPIDRAITALAVGSVTEGRNGGLPDGPILDLTFMLSSKTERPPFDGMRMGGYTAEEQILFFEAAVPEAMGFSENAPQYVAAVLEDVIDNAAEYFEALKIDFDVQRWRSALTPLVASVTGAREIH